MYQVPENQIAKWGVFSGQHRIPAAIDLNCPYCHRDVTFTENWAGHYATHGMPLPIRCPRCDESPRFVLLHDGEEDLVFVHPAPRIRTPIPVDEAHRVFPHDDYLAAISAYNEGHWRPAAVTCRVVLEALVEALLQGGGKSTKGNLEAQLKRLPEAVDLAGPIREAADVQRKLANPAAHYDRDNPPDEATATELMDLTDFLITYLIVMPYRVEELRARIDGEQTATRESTDSDDGARDTTGA